MTTIKIGTDICSIARIAKAYARFGQRLLKRILTPEEMEYVLSHKRHLAARLAARFAAKEAASKALGRGFHGLQWKEIEIVKEPSGAPALRLHGRAAKIARQSGLTCFEVSLSHERDYASALVLAYGAALDVPAPPLA